jgi:hypothetical protein
LDAAAVLDWLAAATSASKPCRWLHTLPPGGRPALPHPQSVRGEHRLCT